jgi:hypothetical protein
MANLAFMRKANICESMIHGRRATVFENRPLGREILTKLWRKIYQRFRGRLHGAFSTPGLNSALFTGLKFEPCL